MAVGTCVKKTVILNLALSFLWHSGHTGWEGLPTHSPVVLSSHLSRVELLSYFCLFVFAA
jgi:hypothetical protein